MDNNLWIWKMLFDVLFCIELTIWSEEVAQVSSSIFPVTLQSWSVVENGNDYLANHEDCSASSTATELLLAIIV